MQEIFGWIIWDGNDKVLPFVTFASVEKLAIGQFMEWATKQRWGYRPWSAWEERGYRAEKVKMIIGNNA